MQFQIPFQPHQARLLCFFFSLSLYLMPVHAQIASSPGIQWEQLPPLPDKEGLAGMFAGIIDGRLVVAGGANFPNGYPWEGGKKFWYNKIYILESKHSKSWITSSVTLPKPLAYGVSYSCNNRLICAGGETGPMPGENPDNPPSCISDVIALTFRDGKLSVESLPNLPASAKDSAGSVIGTHLLHFGGIQKIDSKTAENKLHILDLADSKPEWRAATPLPGPGRIQSVAALHNNELFVFAGIEIGLNSQGIPIRTMPYLNDAWTFSPGNPFENGRWIKLHDMPGDLAAAPGPAWNMDQTKIAIVGGVDSASHRLTQKGHPGWGHDISIYDTSLDRWSIMKNAIPAGKSRVTAPALTWDKDYVLISGEKSPGKRSPEVFRLSSKTH